jgi:hypothetical protein
MSLLHNGLTSSWTLCSKFLYDLCNNSRVPRTPYHIKFLVRLLKINIGGQSQEILFIYFIYFKGKQAKAVINEIKVKFALCNNIIIIIIEITCIFQGALLSYY